MAIDASFTDARKEDDVAAPLLPERWQAGFDYVDRPEKICRKLVVNGAKGALVLAELFHSPNESLQRR